MEIDKPVEFDIVELSKTVLDDSELKDEKEAWDMTLRLWVQGRR